MTNTTHAKFRKEDICYLAGIIDGEGTFNIYSPNPKKFVARLYVVNTHFPLIRWLQATFGGLVYSRTHTKWKTRYEWIFEKERILEISQLILPFLKVKKEQAKIFIKFRSTFPKNRKRLSEETLKIRQDLYIQLKHLNSRSS